MFTNEVDFTRADWPFLQNGAVSLFRNPVVLEAKIADLGALDYRISRVSCRLGQEIFRQQMSKALKWRQQFGYAPWTGNANALHDAFFTYPFGPSGRAALVLEGFHALSAEDDGMASRILDIIDISARHHMLAGKLLIAFIQIDDNIDLDPELSARPAQAAD